MDGWIKIHRQLSDNDLWLLEPFTRGQAWVDLLMLANHDKRTISVRGNRITIDRGQIGRGVRSLAERWQWSKDKVSRFLDELESDKMIGHRETKILGVITIFNYNLYQSCDTDKDTDRTQTRTQIGRNKNEKNEKNEKNNNTMSSNADIEYLFSEFKRFSGVRKILISAKREKELAARLQSFKKDEIRAAWAQMATNKWLRGENDRQKDFFTIDYALRSDRIEHWLNDFIRNNPDFNA